MNDQERIALANRATAFVGGAVDLAFNASPEASRLAKRLVAAREKAASAAHARDKSMADLQAAAIEANVVVEMLADVLVEAAENDKPKTPPKKSPPRVRRSG